jgi:hypothetical protein
MNEKINIAPLRLTKRAEMSEPKVLVDTFVDTGMLQALLTSRDHQVIYGRRGTGRRREEGFPSCIAGISNRLSVEGGSIPAKLKTMAARRNPNRRALFKRRRHDQEIHQEGLLEQAYQLRLGRR